MIWRKRWNHTILHIVLVQFILFFKSSGCKIASAAKKGIDFAPQSAATTFAFSSLSLSFFYRMASRLLSWCAINIHEVQKARGSEYNCAIYKPFISYCNIYTGNLLICSDHLQSAPELGTPQQKWPCFQEQNFIWLLHCVFIHCGHSI